MLERFTLSHNAPEAPAQQLLDTLIIPSFTENSSGEEPHLDQSSRAAALAGGLLVNADLADKIVLLGTPEGTKLMKDYLGDIGIPDKSLITHETSGEHASDIKKIIKNHKHGEIGLVSAGKLGEEIKDGLSQVKEVSLEAISPEAEIGDRIVQSAQESRHAITELLKEAFVNLIRYQKMLDNVKLTRLSPAQ